MGDNLYCCNTCGARNKIVNQCGCDLNNLPTEIKLVQCSQCEKIVGIDDVGFEGNFAFCSVKCRRDFVGV